MKRKPQELEKSNGISSPNSTKWPKAAKDKSKGERELSNRQTNHRINAPHFPVFFLLF